MVKAILINGAQPLRGYINIDDRQGFGRLSLINSVPLQGKNDLEAGFHDRQIVTQGGQPVMYEFTLNESCKSCDTPELSVTMAWPNPPRYISCLKCVLNDLDLLVQKTSTDGTRTLHYPNGLTGKDNANNVERVRVRANPSDSVRVTVSAAHLEDEEQRFSLVWVYGCGEGMPRLPTSNASSRSATLSWFNAACILYCLLNFI